MQDLLLKMADPVGILGVVLILVAYYYLSVGKWIADSMPYQLLNFIGAWMILFSLFFYWNLSSVVIEIAWIAISIVGIYRVIRCQK